MIRDRFEGLLVQVSPILSVAVPFNGEEGLKRF
jgi:hypothetical protein